MWSAVNESQATNKVDRNHTLCVSSAGPCGVCDVGSQTSLGGWCPPTGGKSFRHSDGLPRMQTVWSYEKEENFSRLKHTQFFLPHFPGRASRQHRWSDSDCEAVCGKFALCGIVHIVAHGG